MTNLEIKGFIKCQFEHALYMKKSKHGVLIICLYVDDLLFIRSNPNMFREFKQSMFEEFEMTDYGLMGYFLGIENKQQLNDIFISQKKVCQKNPEEVQDDIMQFCWHISCKWNEVNKRR
jgi:Reverse transcriptase (RNA-dependent DNA polymerase)